MLIRVEEGCGGVGRPASLLFPSSLTQFCRADALTRRGGATLVRETGWLARSCRESRVRPCDPPVCLPGERGLALKRERIDQGVTLHPSIQPALERWAKKFDVSMPQPVSG